MMGGTGRVQIARSRAQLILLATSGLAGTLATVALPAALGRAIDGGGLMWCAALIGIGIVCDLYDAYAAPAYVAGTTAGLRRRVVAHVLSVSPHRLLGFPTGDLVTRLCGHAAEAAQAPLSRVRLALGILPPAGSLVLLSLMDLRLAGAFLAGVGLVALILRSFSRGTTAAASGYQQAQGAIAGRLAEALAGARTIAAAGTVALEQERILRPLDDLRRHGAGMWHVLGRATAQGAVAGPLVLIAVLATGGLLLLSPGEFFAAARYAVLGAGLGGLTGVLGGLARARAASSRVGEVLSVPGKRFGLSKSDGPGRLDFRAATVDGILHDVTFSVSAGTATVVVGCSGSGKSTLAALAARLRDPDAGQILLDGTPLPELSEEALRSSVGCAFEDPKHLMGTLSGAITLGRPGLRAEEPARAVHAHEFIVRLPEGYDTPVQRAPM